MILKPGPLTIKRKGEPEQLSRDWEECVYTFTMFLEATGQIPAHANPKLLNVPCSACTRMKNFMILIDGAEVKALFDHMENVTDTDNWPEILEKVADGIRRQTNQATEWFKLMQRLPQNDKYFTEWYPKIREQAR